MTNGDKIRNMTDEELSALCCTMNHDFPVYALGKCDGDDFECVREDGDCRKCCLEWLRQEVEE